MLYKKLVNNLRIRTSWSVAKLIFKKCELSPRHGWDSTILKFAEDIENQQDIQENLIF
jgi:hypothetical protein